MTTFVIDGNEVLITNFEKGIVPPPMSQHKILLNAQVLDVFTKNCMIYALTVDGIIHVFTEDRKELRTLPASRGTKQIALCGDAVVSLEIFNRLVFRDIEDGDVKKKLQLEKPCVRIFAAKNGDNLFALFFDGSIIQFDSNGNSIHTFHFSGNCVKIEEINIEGETHFFRLLKNNSLYFDNLLLSSSCNSFCLTEKYLVFSTLDHKIHFILLDDLANCGGDFNDSLLWYSRSVERGSSIVTALPSKMCLVTQLPRGNLETFTPRPFVVDFVCKEITNYKYKSAFITCRKHRIDMNLLHDFDPQRFIDELDQILVDLSADDSNLFISSLKNENCILKEFKNMVRQRKQVNFNFETKANFICEEIRARLSSHNAKGAFITILTTFVCQSPPKIDEMVCFLSSMEDKYLIDDGLKYVKAFLPLESLFNNALGLYDFSLAEIIAKNCNMDPKEYVPLLELFKKYSGSYMKYVVDKHLKKYSKALAHLVECGNYDEAFSFAVERCLFTEGMKLMNSKNEYFVKLSVAFAQYLEKLGKMEDAASAYVLGEDYKQAVNLLLSCGKWNKAIILMRRMKISEEEFLENICTLKDLLEANENFKDAAYLSFTYLKDNQQTLNFLLQGKLWNKAIQLVCEQNIESGFSQVSSSCKVYNNELIATIWDYKQNIVVKSERLKKIRSEKVMENTELAEGTNAMCDVVSVGGTSASVISAATTRYSQTSTRTFKTSKSKRKFERRKFDAKEGGFYEEEGLVNELRSVYKRITALKENIVSFLEVTEFLPKDFYLKACELQKEYDELMKLMKSNMKEIFEPPKPKLHDLPTEKRMQLIDSLQNKDSDHDNIDYLLQVYAPIEKPIIKDDPWKLEVYEN